MAKLMSGISWLDVVFLVILLGMVYKGSHAGVGSQLLSLAWLFVLIFVTLQYYAPFTGKLSNFMVRAWAKPMAFCIIVAAMSVVIKFLEIIFNITTAENIAPVERVSGAIIASLRTFLLFGIVGIQFLLLPVGVLQEAVHKNSKTGMFFVYLDTEIYSYMTRYVGFVKPKKRENIVEGLLSSLENR